MNDEQDWYRRHNAEPRRLQPHEWLILAGGVFGALVALAVVLWM
jgi:hypothetical protein